jgi:hypothetical protein
LPRPSGRAPTKETAAPSEAASSRAAPPARKKEPDSAPTPPRPFSQRRFSHDPGYHRLVGQLDYVAIQQGWVVRYAALDEEDRYGGCFTLVDTGPMEGFQSGQTVEVAGELIDPDTDRLRPDFKVHSLQALSGP